METRNTNRRDFLTWIAGATGAGIFAWRFLGRRMTGISAAASDKKDGLVKIVQFTDDGKRIGIATVPKVVKSEEDWRKQLSPEQFEVTRHAGTERAFTGALYNEHAPGIYRCICCDNALFRSENKYESGTGWPSFWAPIASENITGASDVSLGMERTETRCKLCDAHLGHVFDDGPPPSGLRYCMNSAALRFAPRPKR